MEVIVAKKALLHIEYWKKVKNTKIEKRIIELKNAILENPYKGIGNPEPLKHALAGLWSRRIDKTNRFIYAIENDTLIIYTLKGHYE
jgi:toxin YoeB